MEGINYAGYWVGPHYLIGEKTPIAVLELCDLQI